MLDRFQGNLKLREHDSSVSNRFPVVVYIFRRDEPVRSRRHCNRIVPVRRYNDHRDPRWTVRSAHTAHIDSASNQLRAQLFAERIGAYTADHANLMAKPRCSDGLIRTFSAWMHLKIVAVHGFPNKGNPPCTSHEVNVDTPDYDNRFAIHD